MSVGDSPRQWGGPPHGPFLDYTIRFVEHPEQDVGWSRKPSSQAPQAGQTVEGHIVWDAPVRPKFKQDQANQGGATTPTGSAPITSGQTYGTSTGSTWKPRDPADTAAIQRQHCQKVAVQVAEAAGWFGNGFDPGDSAGQAKLKLVQKLATWFQRDIQNGVRIAAEDATTKQEYGERKDTQQTGVSDVPTPNLADFAQQHGAPVDTDDLPF
jgi:hypothetical protein